MFLNTTTYRIAFAFLAVAVCPGCGKPPSPSVTKIPDGRPSVILDSSKPFHIEFGRGSGWHGLDTVKIDETGNVALHRQMSTGWETTSFTLKQAESNLILDSLNENQIFNLDREYHLDGVADGIQWVLWVAQGDNAKTVYFNNHFPKAITKFALDLDSVLRLDGRELTWTAVPAAQIREHEKNLWASIKTQ